MTLYPSNIKKNEELWMKYGESSLHFYSICTLDDEIYVTTSELFERYKKYCRKHNLTINSYTVFGKKMASMGIQKKKMSLADHQGQINCYIGINFFEEDDE